MNEKRTILLIEDERAISNFICRALTADEIAANYAVDKARFNLP